MTLIIKCCRAIVEFFASPRFQLNIGIKESKKLPEIIQINSTAKTVGIDSWWGEYNNGEKMNNPHNG